MLHIATHNGIFHADEVTAVALLEVFKDKEVRVSRIPHDTKDFAVYDMVIDIGRRYDGKKFFDHHQHKGGKSSAGLIWEFLGVAKRYPKVDKLIRLIDVHDTGDQRAGEFEFPNLVKCFNRMDIYGPQQDAAFTEAVAFAKTVIQSYKRASEEMEAAHSIVKASKPFDGNPASLHLQAFTPYWTSYVNGKEMPEIEVVVWYDPTQRKWLARVPPVYPGSYELNGKPFEPDERMCFVHSAGFLAVAPDETTMRSFLADHFKYGRRER